MSSGPPSRNEKPRSAWSSCIEETPTSITTPSTASRPCAAADVGEIGKAILDQGQPAIRTINQIESTGNRRAVAIDADHPGSRHSQDRAAVAAGAEGGVDIDAAVARLQHLDRLAAEHGDMTRRSRGHAPASGVFQCRELESGRETAHRASNALRLAGFPAMEPPQARSRDLPFLATQTLSSDRNLLGCHGISSAKRASAVPQMPVRLFTT